MANEVYANNMEISCKAASGKSICAFPDVCFTPPENPATPPGVPVPYPNTGMASDTTDGSSTVKISGQEVMLKNKSYFKKSTGDEAGCAAKKGAVTSKNMGKVYFKMWSMNVKVEGENVVRHLDITTHNHASDIGNESIPWPHTSKQSIVIEGPCQHPEVFREPADPSPGNPAAKQAAEKHANDRDAALQECFNKQAAGDVAGAAASLASAIGHDGNHVGKAFEAKVSEEMKATDGSIVIKCAVCKAVITEFDVVTSDGVIKECKASAGGVRQSQLALQKSLAPLFFGPGAQFRVHVAVPASEAGEVPKTGTPIQGH